jgi:hypothetical protein
VKPTLSPNERKGRAIAIAILPAALLFLKLVRPGSAPAWIPFPTSCGAVTGLPCIFCGTTRALHFLLNGDFRSALYFNWLAFPIVAGALGLIVLFSAELLLRRHLLGRLPRVRFTRRTAGAFAAGFMLLWSLQVYLAVSQHKMELLNPSGPLYSLVVR